jgi:SSS family solute:Na+ symporter
MPIVRALHRIDPALALAPLNQDDPHAFAWLMLVTTSLTTAVWLTVTLATKPESEATLQAFYDRVRPAALGWRRFASPEAQGDSTLAWSFFQWVLGFTLVYSMLFGVGDLLFGRMGTGAGLLTLSLTCLGVLFWSLNRRGWSVWL